MRILVIGASGLVGSHVLRVAKAHKHEVIGTYRSFPLAGLLPLDISDTPTVEHFLDELPMDAVVCCAAWSWVDGCEKDPKRAFRENRDNPAVLAEAAQRRGAAFLYYSSNYVFDGIAGPYSENDEPHPLSVYGRTKLAGEEAVQNACGGSALIVRTTGVYGMEAQGKNFVYQVINHLRDGKRMRIPLDQLGNATEAGDLAEGSLRLLEAGACGIWNLAGPNPNLRRSDFALHIAQEYQLDKRLLEFSTTAALGQPALRPLNAGLIIERARQALDWHPREWVHLSL